MTEEPSKLELLWIKLLQDYERVLNDFNNSEISPNDNRSHAEVFGEDHD